MSNDSNDNKMVNEFKLTIVHVACTNLMQICACTWIYGWTKNRTGLPGRRGPWAFGLPGSWAVVDSGPWAAGRCLAKPVIGAGLSIIVRKRIMINIKINTVITSSASTQCKRLG